MTSEYACWVDVEALPRLERIYGSFVLDVGIQVLRGLGPPEGHSGSAIRK